LGGEIAEHRFGFRHATIASPIRLNRII